MPDNTNGNINNCETNASQPNEKPALASKRKVAIALLSVAGLLGLCIISIVVIWLKQSSKMQNEQIECQVVLNQFLQCMNNNSFKEARKYLSSSEGKEDPVEKLKSMKNGALGAVFDEYENIKIDYLQEQTPVISGSDRSTKGAFIQATVYYKEGSIGKLVAKMQQEKGSWKILSINIQVPQEKMNNYAKAHS